MREDEGQPVSRESVAFIKALDLENYDGSINGEKEFAKRYTICKLTYKEYMFEGYLWVFEPLWDEIDKAPEEWQHLVRDKLPGIQSEDRKDRYVFDDKLPPFVYQRTPPNSRPNLRDKITADAGMSHYDRFDYMVKTRNICANDYYIVEANPDNKL